MQASVPTFRVSPHQGDRHSGMGGGWGGGVIRLCLWVRKRRSPLIRGLLKRGTSASISSKWTNVKNG